ncbi:MAG: hypothetical protein JST04_05725 [Bdellovibrionales bacterium]|nr:hypothetical protein [Bdellovibrionales bacterium]
MRTLFLVFALSFGLFPGAVRAAEKSVGALFPDQAAIPIDDADTRDMQIGNDYGHFIQCAIAKTVAACDATKPAHFYRFAKAANNEDSYNLMNRCLTVLPSGDRIAHGWVVLNTTNHTVSCSPGPNEIQQAQIALCYEVGGATPGAFCSLATACFAGENAYDRCPRDVPGTAIAVTAIP